MLLTNVPSWALCLAMIAAVLEMAAASHFRGGIIQWRPVDPDNFNGTVLITHRIAWRRSTTEGGRCDANTVAAATLIGLGTLTCRSGCSVTIGSLQYQCTDFSVTEDWSAGEGSNEINLSGVSSFEASYTGCCWISLVQGGGNWEIRVKGDLSPRADNGRINSSPTTAVPPVLTLRHGATHTITIPVSDADGDIVRCRWAESALSECAGVCQVFPATLDQDNCTLTYNANGALGIYAVALQVEDFINASSTVAMSSVPLQFLVQIQEITIPPGVTDPTFVGTTPADRSSIAVGSSYQERITARSGGDNATIVDIITVFPPGLMRSNLTVLNSRESYIDVTWTPSPSQQGLNSFCYAAIDNFGLTSPTRCITLAVGDCPGPPETPSLVSDVPPNAALSWSPPSASGAWSYTYEISWANESVIVPRQAGTTGQIPGLQAETEYTVVVTAYSDSTLCPEQSEPFMFMTSQRCPSPAPMFAGPPTVQPSVVSVNWTAAGSSDPLVTGVRYALYSQCGAETTFQLIDDDIQGLSYNITTLPSLTQCVLRVVVYGDHCLLDVDGPLGATTDNFTTVCEVNEYVHPTSGVCAACPTNSASAGGTPSMCTCNAGTGRVNEADVTLPCLACPGPPETTSLDNTTSVPPIVNLSWSPPSASGAWSYTYEVSWTNGSVIVPKQAGTTGQIPGLQAETEYTVEITAYPNSTLCPNQSMSITFNTTQRCPSPPPMFSGPPTVQPGVVRVSWTAAGSSDPLVTGVRYALYSQCGAETTFQLIDDDIQGLSYDITTLPSLTQCVLRVVVYSDHCLLDVNGLLVDTTDNFTTVCEVNEYIHPNLGVCAACPTNSTSAGGTPSMCTCNAGTGRVNESDVTLPCFACPGLPETPSIVSDIPPNSNLSWSPPSASGAWSYTYEVSWTNGSIIVSRQAGTTGQIPGLQAETEYTVEITAYPDSTLCPDQSTTFVFMTDQRCPSPAPMFTGPPTVQPGVASVNWTAAGSTDPLVTGVRYALYSQCVPETTFQLIDDDIQGLSYDITTLHSLTQCVLRVVVYSDLCLLDVDGLLGDTTDKFTTVCPVNEYVGGSPETCQPCPANSSSPGGVVRVCPCMDGYGRVNDLVPSLPCVVCPGPLLDPRLASPVPPIVGIQWDRPTTPDMWSFMYLIDWQNGTSAVGDTTNTHGILLGLEAVTQYTVTITVFTDSTVCAKQSVNFSFNTTQRCPVTGPQVEPSPEILPGTATVTWQAAQTSDRLLTTGILYAVYSLCGSESRSYQLVAEAIEGLSYTVTGLPAPAQCALRVVAYHRYCLQDLDGVLSDETLPFTTAIAAPEQPPPPTITVGDGGFTIEGLSPKGVVVEYVCSYTSVITGVTSQVRMKPNETADVSLEKVGGYVVQCAGVNGDNYQGAFSEPVTITVEPPETREGSPQRSAIDPLVVSLSVIGVAFAVTLLAVLVGAVIQAKIRCKKKGEQGDIPIESL